MTAPTLTANYALGRKLDSIPFSAYHLLLIVVLGTVGFVEGWFVDGAFRKQGIGAALMRAAEDWSRKQGCREIASDTWIDDEMSIDAHQALGFEVVDRCVHFRKPLE